MPEISVIMGVYNQFNKKILKDAVDSILSQSFTDFEFIIYDDGSNPEAAEILKQVAGKDSRIKLIGHEENHGLAFSLNSCIREAKGKYIARMDADDISYPERLEKQKRFLEDHPDCSWVGCSIELFDEDGVWGRRTYCAEPEKDDYLRFSPFAHPTVMYRADIFRDNRGYAVSEDMLRCEDYEIFMRLCAQGLKGANLEEYLFAYRETGESYKKRTFSFRMNEAKCRYRNYKKLGIFFPKGWIYVLRPIVACVIPAKLLSAIKRRESGIRKETECYEEIRFENKTENSFNGEHLFAAPDRVRTG